MNKKKNLPKNKNVSFKEFLQDYNNSLAIPYYQREYVWSLKSNEYVLRKFVNDIADQFIEDSDKVYFIGNFATCSSALSYIIDGQQRISTMLIFIKSLADKCKYDIKKYFYNNNQFLIKDTDGSTLSQELENGLFKSGATAKSSIAEAIEIIKEEVQKILKNISVEKVKELVDYLLNDVYLSYTEFQNEKDALKYFININGLSVQLTEMEIFYAYIAQLINANKMNSTISISDIKSQIKRIDERIKGLDEEDIVEIFLRTYFYSKAATEELKNNAKVVENKNADANISKLYADKKNKLGVGRWLTGFKMNYLNNSGMSVNFLNKFKEFLDDIDTISAYLTGNKADKKYKFIYFNFLVNRFTKNSYLKNILLALFINRHNYSNQTIKKVDGDIDLDKFNSAMKAIDAVIVTNYFNTSGKFRLDFSELLKRTTPGNNPAQTLKNISYSNMFMLNYPEDQKSKLKLVNNKDEIHFILSLMEAFLNITYNKNETMNSILYEVLDTTKFTIEHLYSIKDFDDSKRLSLWDKKGIFNREDDFDKIRSNFENLSILDMRNNSKAGTNHIADKIKLYENANSIGQTSEPELLIQSFNKDSRFYSNEDIKKLNLPERFISIEQNGITWSLNQKNRDFNEILAKLAVDELFK